MRLCRRWAVRADAEHGQLRVGYTMRKIQDRGAANPIFFFREGEEGAGAV